MDRDLNINGRHGTLPPRQHGGAYTSSSSGEDSDGEMPGPSADQMYCVPRQALIFNESENAGPSNLGMAAFRDTSPVFRPNSTRNRQRQLESLRRMEERIRNLSRNVSGVSNEGNKSPAAAASPCSSPSKSPTRNAMSMFVLDISQVLSNECYVEWLPVKSNNVLNGEPREKILYTLIAGKGELIMFGGIQKDATSITPQAQLSSDVPNTVSNSLHFITAPKGII